MALYKMQGPRIWTPKDQKQKINPEDLAKTPNIGPAIWVVVQIVGFFWVP